MIGDPGQVAVLVKRVRYQDWSLPKGKVDAGEHALATAVREVWDETGEHVVLGPRSVRCGPHERPFAQRRRPPIVRRVRRPSSSVGCPIGATVEHDQAGKYMYHAYMSRDPVLVTGALGTIGRAVVADLLAAGRPVRAADLDPATISDHLGEVEPVRFDFTDSSTWAAAFAGVPVMFLMRPPHISDIARDMVPALEAARSAGVRHMVLLSLQGAERNKVVPHAKLEAWLRGSGLDWTFVRPSFFMENLSTTHAADVRDRDSIIVPAGRGRTSFVAAADVAAVASAALIDPAAHRQRAWTPTGPAALTYTEVAEILSRALGRPIRYTHPGAIRYARHAMRDLGMPRGMALVTTAIYTVARLGRAGGLTDDVRAVTGRAPIDLETWAIDHREAWERRG